MDKQSTEFLRRCFGRYYRNNSIALPERFGKREFAFMPFGAKIMRRHLSFKREKDIRNFILNMIPAHAYYSSAFYQNPNAPTMEEKGWMGAELIFDLDLDHLRGVKNLSYEEGLKVVKEEFKKLVQDFLMQDFGFEKRYLKLYFSGGRGYHCHVLDPKVFQLDSSERREIVDYIIGRDLNENEIFRERIIETFTIRGRKMPKKRLEMPRPNEPGWRGRIGRGIAAIIRDVIDNNVEGLKKYGIKEKDIERLRKELTGERVRRILEDGIVDQSPYIRRFFLKAAIQKAAVLSMAGETDEPVTCDVKRLIRLPTSLHGKTGLKVCEIDIDRIDDFDPLYDAVVLGDDPIDIELSSKLEIKMKGERFSLSKGRQRVPEFLAVLLVGRGIAKII